MKVNMTGMPVYCGECDRLTPADKVHYKQVTFAEPSAAVAAAWSRLGMASPQGVKVAVCARCATKA